MQGNKPGNVELMRWLNPALDHPTDRQVAGEPLGEVRPQLGIIDDAEQHEPLLAGSSEPGSGLSDSRVFCSPSAALPRDTSNRETDHRVSLSVWAACSDAGMGGVGSVRSMSAVIPHTHVVRR